MRPSGASGYVTTYNGTSWSTPTDADSTRTLDAVSCTSSSFCVAVDTSGYATIYNGSSWSTPTDIDSTRSINAVKCTSSSFCAAVGASGYVTTYNGTSWSTATDADSTRDHGCSELHQFELLCGRRHLGLCRQLQRDVVGNRHRHRLHPERRLGELCEL